MKSPRWPVPALLAVLCGLFVFFTVAAIRTGKSGPSADFVCFYRAAEAARAGTDLYKAGSGVSWYIYPPLLAVLLVPLTALKITAANIAWKLLTVLFLVLSTVLGVGEAARRVGPRPGADARVSTPDALFTAAAAWLLTTDKIAAEIKLGQCDFLLILPFILALSWLGRRPILCGLALGFTVHIKYLSLVFLPFLLARGRWREAAAMAASIALFGFLPALYLGWDRNTEYLGTALRGLHNMAADVPLADAAGGPAADIHELTWERSVSIPSAMARLARHAGWPTKATLPLSAAAAVAVLAAAWGVYRSRAVPLLAGRGGREDDASERGRAVTALEWCGVIVAALLFSPQTTARHMILLLPVMFSAGAVVLASRPRERGLLVAGLVVMILGLVLPPGGEGHEQALNAWRAVAGASWCVLVMYLTLLWAGLGAASRADRTSPPGLSPAHPG